MEDFGDAAMNDSLDMRHESTRLRGHFFNRDPRLVAPDLLGKILWCNGVGVMITETEAYLPFDTACHAHKRKTARNAPMFEAAGTIYVYLCYGIFNLLNVVTQEAGPPSAVLLRAGKAHHNPELIRARRKGNLDLVGPGKFGQAIEASREMSGTTLLQGSVFITPGLIPCEILTKARVGIDYAEPEHRDALWRYVAADFLPEAELHQCSP